MIRWNVFCVIDIVTLSCFGARIFDLFHPIISVMIVMYDDRYSWQSWLTATQHTSDIMKTLYACLKSPPYFMMTSSNGIPLTKVSYAELWCFIWSAPWINGWVNNHEADLRRHRAHYGVIVILTNVTTANLRRLLSNMMAISNREPVFWSFYKIWKTKKRMKFD